MGNLLNAMFGTFNAGNPNMEVRWNLANVQMAELPFLRMIIQAAELLAGWAREANWRSVIDVNIYPRTGFVQ